MTLLVVPIIKTQARFPYSAIHYGFFYGTTQRLDKNFYHSFEVSRERYRTTCTTAKFAGLSLGLDYFKTNNYQADLSYYKSFNRNIGRVLFPFWSIGPTAFKSNNEWGINLKPRAGLRLFVDPWAYINIYANLAWAYDIPIISETSFNTNRHDFSFRLGIAIDFDIFNRHDRETEDEF